MYIQRSSTEPGSPLALGARTRLPHETVSGSDEKQAQRRSDRSRLAEEKKRGVDKVCYLLHHIGRSLKTAFFRRFRGTP